MAMFNLPHPGGLITEYIEDNNISLRVLAKELGVSASALSKVASGRHLSARKWPCGWRQDWELRRVFGYPYRLPATCIRLVKPPMFPACISIRA